MSHNHNWQASLADETVRCVHPACKAKLTLMQLSEADRTKYQTLDEVWESLQEPRGVAERPVKPAQITLAYKVSEEMKADDIYGGKVPRKTCSACGEVKKVNEFHKRSRAYDGLQSCCKQCNIKRASASRAKRAALLGDGGGGSVSGTTL